MILLKHILSRFDIVVAHYDNGKDYHCLRYSCCYKQGDIEIGPAREDPAPDNSHWPVPLLLYIRGYGVIDKPADQIDRIVADRGKFLFSMQKNGAICFIRKSQIEPLLEKTGKSLFHIGCLSGDTDVIEASKEHYTSIVVWKNLLRPDPVGSRLSTWLYKKTKLFVLIAVLILLSVNFAVRRTVDEKYAENHALLTVLQKEKGRRNELSKQEQELLGMFSVGLGSGFARLADRIGRAVPEPVVLRNLAIQPPVKTLETGKPFHIEAFKIRIKGVSPDAAGISLFVARLRDTREIKDLKIASAEQNRDGKSLDFIIEIEL